jgi:hypothetical protein
MLSAGDAGFLSGGARLTPTSGGRGRHPAPAPRTGGDADVGAARDSSALSGLAKNGHER